jgi:hypothetical protein
MKKEVINIPIKLKREYMTPYIIPIEIDNEISLSMESEPMDPDEPGISYNNVPKADNLIFKA